MARRSGLGILAASMAALVLFLCLQVQLSYPSPTNSAVSSVSTIPPSPAQPPVDRAAGRTQARHRPVYRTLLSRDTTWEQAVKKANDFICIWQGATVDQSEFQAFEDLETDEVDILVEEEILFRAMT